MRTPIHFPFLLALLCAVPTASAQKRWDFGPFLASSVTVPGADPEEPEGIVEKAVTVRVGTKDAPAAVCFDTDLLSYAGGWSGGWLKLMGTSFDGTHRPPERSRPAPAGELAFGVANAAPGWAGPGSGGFNDPRPRPYGPLPAAWAKYRGLYVHGDRVVFSYTVDGRDVLETPEFSVIGQCPVFVRTFHVGPGKRAITVYASDMKPPAGDVVIAITGADGVEASSRDGRHLATVRPTNLPTAFRIALTRRDAAGGEALRSAGTHALVSPSPLSTRGRGQGGEL